jgi:hypothetical protein
VQVKDASHGIGEVRTAVSCGEDTTLSGELDEEPRKIAQVLVETSNEVRWSIRCTHASDDGRTLKATVHAHGSPLIENRHNPRSPSRKQACSKFAVQRLRDGMDQLEFAVPMTRAAHTRQRCAPDPFQEHVPAEHDAASSRAEVVAHPGAEVPVAVERHHGTPVYGVARLEGAKRECVNKLLLEASTEAVVTRN